MPNATGRFCWYDLWTTDPEAAVPFYTEVIGWSATPWQPPEEGLPPYTMWMNGETMLGGVGPLAEEARAAGAPPTWVVYVATDDVEDTIGRAQTLGGSVRTPPTVIPTVGRFAVLADPQGDTFCLFQADREPPGHDGPPQVGEFSWHELVTTDPQAAFGFYRELFGWVEAGVVESPTGPYRMFGRSDDLPVGGICAKCDEIPASGWLPYVRVHDVHEAVGRVEAKGGEVLQSPMEVPGGDWIAQGRDPQGGLFALHSRPAA